MHPLMTSGNFDIFSNKPNKKQQVHYINISESRTWYQNFDGTTTIKMIREACIQRADDLDGSVNNHCRVYRDISEASILRLAKIQEKLAQ